MLRFPRDRDLLEADLDDADLFDFRSSLRLLESTAGSRVGGAGLLEMVLCRIISPPPIFRSASQPTYPCRKYFDPNLNDSVEKCNL